ncbi:MAG: lipoprotein B transmembrane [Cycloclasticus sp.]|nr:lipoprotein B transmembrane [Cycloclasticus sp.]MBG97041.1 lipoprotein B transmembrane [Cycloclasticus sp.]|tara:strand:- start:106 stop:633 length:528 start_codon:yes stop_codon:yes gene_type:complete
MNTQTGSFVMLRSMTMLCLLSVSLMACGFKLRGAVDLPEELQKIYIAGSQHSHLVRDLSEMLGYSAEVVQNRTDADAVLVIKKEESDNRTLSVDSRGKVRESEMQYAVVYSLVKSNGDVLLDNETLLLVRDFIDDENDVIGRTNESVVISRDLKRDAAQQILRRIQALKPGSAVN